MIAPFAQLEKLALDNADYARPSERGRRHQIPQPVSMPVDFRHAGRHAAQKVTEDASAGKVPLTRAATDVMRDAVSAATKDQTGGEDARAWMKHVTGPAYRRVFDHQMKTAQPDIDSSDTQKLLQQYGKGVLGELAATSEAYAAKHGLLSKSSSAHATPTAQRATEKSAARGDFVGKILKRLSGRSKFAINNPQAEGELMDILGRHMSVRARKLPVGTPLSKLDSMAPLGEMRGPAGVNIGRRWPGNSRPPEGPRVMLPRNSNVSGELAGWANQYRHGLAPTATKSAATSEAPIVQDEKSRKDEAALRNRHILLALKRALQGGAAGAFVGGLGASDEKKGQGALLGLLAGGVAGAGVGAAEGGVKRAIGLDPLLQTIATARRP